MYTQCTHCQAVFRVTTAELTSSDGKVRCGECQQVFNGLESLSILPPEPATDRGHRSRIPAPETPMPLVPGEVIRPGDPASVPTIPDEATLPPGPAPDPAVHEDMKTEPPPAPSPIPLLEPAQSDTSAPPAPPPSTPMPRVLQDELHAVALHGTRHLIGTLALGIFSFLLIGLLAVQVIYHERNRLVSYPELASTLQWLCRHLDCNLPPRRAPDAFQLSSRNIYSHPNVPDALMVQATLINQATFAQPYPMVELSFRGLQGELLAVRRFLPAEYLQNPVEDARIAPNQNFQLRLEIEDPGPGAVAYEFRFL